MAQPENMVTATDPAPTPEERPEPGQVRKKGKPAPTPEELGEAPDALVTVRITERGAGQVHDGKGGRYDFGDEVVLPLGVARNLRGEAGDKKALNYVEIVGKA